MSRQSNILFVSQQSQSRFLQLPYDVRFIIYKHILPSRLHIHCHDGKLQVSECLQPFQLKSNQSEELEQKFAPRGHDIFSTWITHSPCEKAMLSRRFGRRDVHWNIAALELTCKLTYSLSSFNLARCLADLTTPNSNEDITLLLNSTLSFLLMDLPTFDNLLYPLPELAPISRISALFLNVKHHELEIKPPILLLRLMSQQCSTFRKSWLPTMRDIDRKMLRAWMSMGKSVAKLEKLEHLVICVDGEDEKAGIDGAFWWNVDHVKSGEGTILPGRGDVKVVVRRKSVVNSSENLKCWNSGVI